MKTNLSFLGKITRRIGLNSRFVGFGKDEFDLDDSVFVSPVEAKLVYVGGIEDDGCLISKFGRKIDLDRVVDGAYQFKGGDYFNFYLSPRDKHYWRIPYDGELVSTKVRDGEARVPVAIGLERFFPGTDFFEKAVKSNATIGSVFRAKDFLYSMIAVGSLNVNSIRTVDKNYFKKGDVGGYFNLGSSMLLCFPEGVVESLVETGDRVEIGEAVARVRF